VKEIVVVSGKGGTGKTSIVAAFSRVAGRKLAMGDCDVDASNLAILVPGEDDDEEPFHAGSRARIDVNACTGCARCETACRYGAIEVVDGLARVHDLKCEGCRACSVVCDEDAISFAENRAGTLFRRPTPRGPLIHAALGVAQDNSGKLVARVREVTREAAQAAGLDLAMFDGPPGIGCPVHAAVGGASLLVIVTEPSISGVHDLGRILELARHFELDAAVLVNKAGLHPEAERDIEDVCEKSGVRIVGRIPFDERVPAALARGETPLAVEGISRSVEAAWGEIEKLLGSDTAT